MKTVIIGYGNLGKIYAEVFIRQKFCRKDELFVLCKNEKHASAVKSNGHGKPVFKGENLQADLVLLAVKPQDAGGIFDAARQFIHPATLVLSVMAGINISLLEERLKHDKIVRAMPNSPVSIGLGATGYSASPALSKAEIKQIEDILSVTGRIFYFEDEDQLDAVTALSGSGPAYVFYFLQSLTEAGIEMGFTPEVASMLAQETIKGALGLFQQSGQNTQELIATVASKGGTTEAAFKVFDQYKSGEILKAGIQAAHQRAVTLGNQISLENMSRNAQKIL